MIVTPQDPARIIINAEIKSETSVVNRLSDASHDEALQIAAFLFMRLCAIQRDINAANSRVNETLGDDDDL